MTDYEKQLVRELLSIGETTYCDYPIGEIYRYREIKKELGLDD